MRVPSYRLHKPSGLAVVTIAGVDHYLGPHGSADSRREYDRRIAAWLAAGRPARPAPADPTVGQVAAAYRLHARQRYRKGGKPTSELGEVRLSVLAALELYEDLPARDFGPLALQAVRDRIAASGVCRATVNGRVRRVRRMFRWAVARELIPETVYRALCTVEGLRAGESPARETDPVAPVADSVLEAIRPHVGRIVWSMIELQRLTGMRPGEVVILRPADLELRTTGPWLYRPATHKTAHRGHDRIVRIGPAAQEVLAPFLARPPMMYCFSPREAAAEHNAEVRARRKTKLWPSHTGQARRLRAGRRAAVCLYGDRYAEASYRQAIRRGCDRAFPPAGEIALAEGESAAAWEARLAAAGLLADLRRWRAAHRFGPHQIRHTAATAIRERFGAEGAQVILGHRRLEATEIYAERSARLADRIAREIG